MRNYIKIIILGLCLMMISGCGRNTKIYETKKQEMVTPIAESPQAEVLVEPESEEDKVKEWKKLFENLEIAESYKGKNHNNPIMTQSYGADPYAMVYQDEVYFYMTADAYEYDAKGIIQENSYSKIKSIRVVSTKDMVNFTDHGEVRVASTNGRAKWAHNSWAPAAAWKEIEGKPRFFLYFADAGGGIGVLQADSPTGPFTDPLGKGLVTRDTPTCKDVLWLFDPAVLVDDDGKAYLYFGGGVPDGKAEHPQTARVVELGEDMISLAGEPRMIDAPFVFEDSGIHKYKDKYYYTYCSNWNVDHAGTEKYGFENGEIICMESDSPTGPFTLKEKILENPGKTIGLYGNNHHCVFNFKDQWYITYHSRILEKNKGVEKGYRSTNINAFEIGEDGTIGIIKQTLEGCKQLNMVNPYVENAAVKMAQAGGVEAVAADQISMAYGAGEMVLGKIDSGDYVQIKGVDFEQKFPSTLKAKIRKVAESDETCMVQLRLDSLEGQVIAYLPVGTYFSEEGHKSNEFIEMEARLLKKVKGVHDLYMVFSGSGYEMKSWYFDGIDNWYEEMIEKSLVSEGNNSRLEKVMKKLEQGDNVSVAYIGGSVTEGAGAANLTESYADRVVQYLKTTYPSAHIDYNNAGLGGTASTLGIMRYRRDVIHPLGKTPDMVFVEFAVNDYQEPTKGRAYESLVRDILEENEDTAVILVFAVFKSKWNMQDHYIPVGEHYGLPMVSVKNATDYAYEKGKLKDKEYFYDDFHPTSYGHQIMADCVTYLLKEVASHKVSDEPISIPEAPKLGKDFQHMKLVTAQGTQDAVVSKGSFSKTDKKVHSYMRNHQLTFPGNWMYGGDGGQEAFKMKVSCSKLFLNYKQSNSTDFGTACVYVDGKLVSTCNAYSAGGWNNSIVILALDEKESSEHEVLIKMQPGDENKKFTILAMGYCD